MNCKLFKCSNEAITEVVSLEPYVQGTTRVFGRNLKDLFYKTDFGIGHYDGTDGKILFNIEKPYKIINAQLLEKEVYFLCNSYQEGRYFMLHGKLTD